MEQNSIRQFIDLIGKFELPQKESGVVQPRLHECLTELLVRLLIYDFIFEVQNSDQRKRIKSQITKTLDRDHQAIFSVKHHLHLSLMALDTFLSYPQVIIVKNEDYSLKKIDHKSAFILNEILKTQDKLQKFSRYVKSALDNRDQYKTPYSWLASAMQNSSSFLKGQGIDKIKVKFNDFTEFTVTGEKKRKYDIEVIGMSDKAYFDKSNIIRHFFESLETIAKNSGDLVEVSKSKVLVKRTIAEKSVIVGRPGKKLTGFFVSQPSSQQLLIMLEEKVKDEFSATKKR